jgi:D-alanine-D-alanine ligase
VSAAKLNVAVLMGGPSAEAEVSRVSAAEVANGIEAAEHKATLLELDANTAKALLEIKPDIVFPALHGPPGEDGTVQGFLEIMGIPYVGSDVHGSATAMDKALAKAVFRQAELPVLDDMLISTQDEAARSAHAIRDRLGGSVVLKPLRQGSAIGVVRVTQGQELEAAVARAIEAQPNETSLLVEPFVVGKEVTVGVIDLHGVEAAAFQVIEIETASDEWYDYTNRYTLGKSKHIIPARLDAEVNQRLQDIAITAHNALGLRDLSRADYLVTKDDEIIVLEVNTLPGMTPTSLYPDGARAMGMDFATLMDELIRSAHRRGR